MVTCHSNVTLTTDLLTIHISIGQGHWRIVFIHRITREGADEIRLGAVGKWEGFSKGVKWFGTYWTLCVAFLLLVTLTEYTVKEPSDISMQ